MKVFEEDIARTYDDWLTTPCGSYIDGREKDLINELLIPKSGERILDVGCGTGSHLLFFREKGCQVTGIEPSSAMLDVAYRKLRDTAELRTGYAEDLPFSDNEFDMVTLITALEFIGDPLQAIREAIRVSRGRVFLGVLNKYSFIGAGKRMRGAFRTSLYHEARFYGLPELQDMIRSCLGDVAIRWGSVIFLPYRCYTFASSIEERIPTIHNPFGAFLGVAFSVVYQYRTLQDVIREPFNLSVKGHREVRGAVRSFQSVRTLKGGQPETPWRHATGGP